MKNDNMVVEPYNFTLCYNQIIRSSSLVTAFSNEQIISQLKEDQRSRASINTSLGNCFNSIFNQAYNGKASLQDICQNINACPQINQAYLSQKQLNHDEYQHYLLKKFNNESMID